MLDIYLEFICTTIEDADIAIGSSSVVIDQIIDQSSYDCTYIELDHIKESDSHDFKFCGYT